MTNRQAFATGLAVLFATFDKPLSDAAVEGYWMALRSMDEHTFAAVTARALTECKFMSTPSELLALSGRARSLPAEAALAWEVVRQAMDRHDYTTSVDFGPLVNSIVRNLGGWVALCDASVPDLVWRRKDFERLYEEFAAKAIDAERGAPLRGSFGGAPVRIAIGGALPPAQIEARPTNGSGELRALVRELAEEKSR